MLLGAMQYMASSKKPIDWGLCFTAEQANSTVSMVKYSSDSSGISSVPSVSLLYSHDAVNWDPFVVGATVVTLANVGDKVWIRAGEGGNLTFAHPTRNNAYNKFTGTGRLAVSGNIMSLLDGKAPTTTLASKRVFYGLFKECTALVSAAGLSLPAPSVTEQAYGAMFSTCSSLASAPSELPATSLATGCYQYMFHDCTSLVSVPAVLPATTLVKDCYNDMFNGCTLLTTTPALRATTLAVQCYSGMFNGCTSLTAAPALPVTTLAESCYSSMFGGCTSLTTAPSLPATTAAWGCYANMFNGCTSLTAAPALPVTTLAASCYSGMFRSCTSLTTMPSLPVTTLAATCYKNMFRDCTSLTTIQASLPATDPVNGCYGYMFYGCTSLTKAPKICLTSTRGTGSNIGTVYQMFYKCNQLTEVEVDIADSGTFLNASSGSASYQWLSGVAASGTFKCPSSFAATVGRNVSGVPSGWTIVPNDAA